MSRFIYMPSIIGMPFKDFARFYQVFQMDFAFGDSHCKYSSNDKAVKKCNSCGAGLCSSCGYSNSGISYCNECWNVRTMLLEHRPFAYHLSQLKYAIFNEILLIAEVLLGWINGILIKSRKQRRK